MFLSVHVPTVHPCVSLCVCLSAYVCVCVCKHTPSEDGADVHAVAHCLTCLKMKGFSLFVSNFTGRPNGHSHPPKINK